MRDEWIPNTPELYAEYLANLKLKRADRKTLYISTRSFRNRLTKAERTIIKTKTDGKCHICGGDVGDNWEADHVLARSGGGKPNIDNYLPAHRMCNNYRWDYMPEEFQEILRLGVWLRTQVQTKKKIGMEAAEYFIDYEKKRISRRKTKL